MKRAAALLILLAAAACGGQGQTGPDAVIPPAEPPAGGPISGGATEVFVGAGDIGFCGSEGARLTASLLDRIDGTVFTLGDNAYPSGTHEQFRDCYDPTWGRQKSRTRPTPGNHEYEAAGAIPYFSYFGASAGPAGRGYYSFMLNGWTVVALNSNIPAGRSSAQARWLASQLSSRPTACTIAYWHHPLFASGPHGGDPVMLEIWRILYEAGADVILSGHEHLYERFAPMDPGGAVDLSRGIREFVAGTGGAPLTGFDIVQPNSEARDSAYGVLKMTLRPGGYRWEFITAAGTSDVGDGVCH